MGIQIEKSFSIDAPKPAVWQFLNDPERVANCLPGASITEKVDERTYKGKMSMKVGPVSASYRGKMTFERLDEEAGEAELKASAQDVGGRGGAEMKMSSKLVELDSGHTEVTVVSEVNVMGLLAQLGRGMIQDVSDVLFEQFSEAMRQDLAQARAEAVAVTEDPSEADGTDPIDRDAAEPVQADPSTSVDTQDEIRIRPPRTEDSPHQTPQAEEASASELDAVDFGAKVARRAFARRLSSPGFWIVVALVAALIWWMLR